MQKGLNQVSSKHQNRGLILKLVATGECTSRIAVAKRTQLSKMAASNLIAEYIAEGVIEEREQIRVEGKGRNPIELVIASGAPKMIGLHIFRDRCSAILCDLQLNILRKSSFRLDAVSARQFFSKLYRIIDAVMNAAGDARICGIGIGSSGPVDIETGVILRPPNFFGLQNIDVVSRLKARYNLPVFFDSQYDCAALAEKYYGNGRDVDDFMFVGIANGIGSGVISSGRVLYSHAGLTSELGHVSIDVRGNDCSCGNKGCVETYVSTPIIEGRMQKATGLNMTFREFCTQEDEAVARKLRPIFEEMIEYLACSLVSVANLFNPQKIIMGHDSFWIPDGYLSSLEETINRRKLSGNYKHVAVQKSFFEDESQFRGCACSLLTKIFDNGVL